MDTPTSEENIQTVTNLPEVKENIGKNLIDTINQQETTSTTLSTEVIANSPLTESRKRLRKDGKERKPFVFTEKRKEAFEKCKQSRLSFIEKKRSTLEELGLEKETSKREQQLEKLKNKYIEKMRRAGIEIEIHNSQLGKKRVRETQLEQIKNGSGAGNHAPFEGEIGYNGGNSVDVSVATTNTSLQHDEVMSSNEIKEEIQIEEENNVQDDVEENVEENSNEMNDEEYNQDDLSTSYSNVENIQSQIEEIRASRPPETLPTVFEERRSNGKVQRPNNSDFFLGHIHDYKSHPSQLFSNTGTKQINSASKVVWLE